MSDDVKKRRRERYEVRDDVERMMGVEPTLPAWEAEVLPMNYIRAYEQYSIRSAKIQLLFFRFFR